MHRKPPGFPKFQEVYDVPSGLGGSFTVSVVERLPDGLARVRVWYGRPTWAGWESWPEWDGYQFTTAETNLTNKRVQRTTIGA